jgi:GT2 family glycosyltransferase
MVRREFPSVDLRETGANLGFSGGNNIALADNTCDYVFLLNSDATLPKGGLDTLLAWADTTPDAGLIGPKVINPDGTLQFSCRRWPTPQAGLFRNVYIGKLFPQNQPAADYLMRDFDHASPLDVDWLSGCAMLMRRACLEQVGPLDDKTFFMYCEDMDWSLRVHDAGWRVVYAPVMEVTHKIGGSSDQVAERMIVEHSRAMVRFWRKHQTFFASRTPAWVTALVLPWAILRATVRILKRIITGQAFTKRKPTATD